MKGAKEIFQSRRFWTMLLSVIVALVLYFVGKYLPAQMADVKFVIDLITPLAFVLIAAFTVDDAIKLIMSGVVEMQQNSLAAQIAMLKDK